MRAFIQAEEGQPADLNFFAAQQGFRELGFHCTLFEDVNKIELCADDPVVGFAGTVLVAVERLGCKRPPPLGFPAALTELARRKIKNSTLAEVRSSRSAAFPFFIKPLWREKAFPGVVVRQRSDLARLSHLDGALDILVSDVIDLVSEYRIFVLRGEPIGCRHYKADFRVFPELSVADQCIALYKDAPISYVLDVGVTKDKKTVPIEVNDGFSLGAYGLAPRLYARFLEARWWQMTKAVR
jgi:hypothetical protein